jgi:hypothetical protein
MTRLRMPDTFEDAIMRIMGLLTPAGAAAAVGRSVDLLRRWSNEDLPEGPSLAQALALDLACLEQTTAGGAPMAPVFEVYAARLQQAGVKADLKAGLAPMDPRNRLLRVLAEVGDVSRAVQAALGDGRLTQAERVDVLRELREARDEINRLTAEVEQMP